MKKLLFIFMAMAIFFSSCEDDDSTSSNPSYVVEASDAFIVNYGSYSSTVGSISGFDIDNSKMYSYVFESVNGPAMNGKPQYAYEYNDKIYFMGNNVDEVFYVNSTTLEQTKNGVTTDIVKPRYCVGDGNYLYISCYGGDVWSDATLGYIAKYNIKSNTVESTIEIAGGPEGLEIVNGKLYVALNYAAQIAVVDLDTEDITYITTPSVTSYFLKDDSDNLYVSLLSTYTDPSAVTGLGYINTTTDELASTYSLSNVSTNYASIMTFNADQSKIYIAAASWVEDNGTWVQKGSIFAFDTTTKTFDSSPYVSSIDGLNALSVNPNTNDLYVLISNSTTTTGKLVVYDENGDYQAEYQTGISPSWVLYKEQTVE